MNKIMSINSALFLIFVAVTLILYGVIPQRFRKYVLLAASVFFYLMSSLRSFAFLLGTIILTYLGGIILDSMNLREKDDLARLAKEEKTAAKKAWQRKKRIILSSALAINFLTLAVFKYLDSWFAAANSFLSSLGLSFSFPSLELLLPLGISFYIFQTAGYLIDVYRGKTRAERGFLDYAIFACYFPQMIQGPINRYSELSPQLKEGKKLSAENIRSGILLMMWGMLKKVFIADVLSPGVTAIYSNYQAYPGIIIFLGASMYC
ncbi:MAG: MBOAT family protein, partial [Clostridiales bacterium]|nr:MBOAT family protein [Clostridiales bacterium]